MSNRRNFIKTLSAGTVLFSTAAFLKGCKPANRSKDDDLVQAHKRMLYYPLNKAPRTSDGIIHHTLNAPEVWVDSIYMAPPYLCVAGHPQEAIRQIKGIRNH